MKRSIHIEAILATAIHTAGTVDAGGRAGGDAAASPPAVASVA
jgi:hypothetical protein